MALTTIDRSVRRLFGLFMALTCADLSLLLRSIVATIVFVFVFAFALVFVVVSHFKICASEMALCMSSILQLVGCVVGPRCAAHLHTYTHIAMLLHAFGSFLLHCCCHWPVGGFGSIWLGMTWYGLAWPATVSLRGNDICVVTVTICFCFYYAYVCFCCCIW